MHGSFYSTHCCCCCCCWNQKQKRGWWRRTKPLQQPKERKRTYPSKDEVGERVEMDPWRGSGAADGAAVPVSGVCASAAAHLGTERLFCCWWVETCQRFAPDRVILRPSAFTPPPLSLLSVGNAQHRGSTTSSWTFFCLKRGGKRFVVKLPINTIYLKFQPIKMYVFFLKRITCVLINSKSRFVF